jgi:hypothetical protein
VSIRRPTHPGGAQARLTWIKATRSQNQGACVEAAALPGGEVAVRDTKDAGIGPVLVFTAQEWHSFLDGAKKGEFDRLA